MRFVRGPVYPGFHDMAYLPLANCTLGEDATMAIAQASPDSLRAPLLRAHMEG